ncbi:MAG: peptidoglycan-associated lipoprotein Pal [Gammaproteobacteria bacterium]|nr:peptidoglycan-associated lipoprotein Pal [Gammaproteobacteria bacterium]MCP5137926.1 peptidoglycan-associated lipoprotein Pal [Gammaproteobacteria bacterium]
MNQMLKLLLIGLFAIALGGCGEDSTRQNGDGGEVVEGAGGAGSSADGASTAGAGAGSKFSANALDDPASPLAVRVIYFAYDSDEVLPEYRPNLNTHAEFLAANPSVHVVVEGHADERGTREYNIALGERRAQAVRRLLLFQGAAFDQVEVVSYGEERAIAFGHDEDSWKLNRRAELKYEGH